MIDELEELIADLMAKAENQDTTTKMLLEKAARKLSELKDERDESGLPFDTAHDLIYTQKARIATLEAALQELAGTDCIPAYISELKIPMGFGPDLETCGYCGQTWIEIDPEDHAADCPITRARALLLEENHDYGL